MRQGALQVGQGQTRSQLCLVKLKWHESSVQGMQTLKPAPATCRCSEEVVPPELADPSDAFGLLRRCIPRRIGKSEGPKARVLVRLGGEGRETGRWPAGLPARCTCATLGCMHASLG